MSSKLITREEAQALIGPEGALPLSAGTLYLGEGQYAEYPAAEEVVDNVANMLALQSKLVDELERTQAEKNTAYKERNQLVALVAAFVRDRASKMGSDHWDAWLGKHQDISDPRETEDNPWDPEWMNVVYIKTPAGQLSWHLHDSDVDLFEGLPSVDNDPFGKYLTQPWDGHTTEEKYRRIRDLFVVFISASTPEKSTVEINPEWQHGVHGKVRA